MQVPIDPSFLIKLLLSVFFFAIFIWLFIYLTRRGEIRGGGVSNAFVNDDEGEQNASKADIQASRIDNSFINNKKGKQNFQEARIICGQSSQAANSEENRLLNNLLQLVAYLFGGGKYPANSKGKQI